MKVFVYYQKVQKTQASSHDLLRLAVSRYLAELGDLPDWTGNDLTIEQKTKWGKPYIKELPEVHFSISHSGTWWSCAFAPQEVGLDLQLVQERNLEKLAKRFFHPRELEWLRGKEAPQFYRLWTYKESYVKYTGKGLLNGLDYFSAVQNQKEELGTEGVFQQELPFPAADCWMVLTTKIKAQPVLEQLIA